MRTYRTHRWLWCVTSLTVYIGSIHVDWIGKDFLQGICDYFGDLGSKAKTQFVPIAFVYQLVWLLVSAFIGRLLHDVPVMIFSRGRSNPRA